MAKRNTEIYIKSVTHYWWQDNKLCVPDVAKDFYSTRYFKTKRKAMKVLMSLPVETLAYIVYHDRHTGKTKYFSHPENKKLLSAILFGNAQFCSFELQ